MAQQLIKRGEVYWVDLSLPSPTEKEKGVIHELQKVLIRLLLSLITNKIYLVP